MLKVLSGLVGVGICSALLGALTGFASTQPDWSEEASIPITGRPNPYSLSDADLQLKVRAGKIHALEYPVEVTGALIPYDVLRRSLEDNDQDPIRAFLKTILSGITRIHSMDEGMSWMGLHRFPAESDTGVYSVPYPGGKRPETRMGFTLIERHGVKGFTFGCATCHAGHLFGKKVLGLTNRFPRANHTFVVAGSGLEKVNPHFFRFFLKASANETKMYSETRASLARVSTPKPIVLGLDTSLAQVSLSLARRSADENATPNRWLERFPRHEPLAHEVADSKPAVWWNLKYKTRWLSDGSLVSGNPIYTNFLWNELGRGTELDVLDQWLQRSEQMVEELTSAVFASEAPRFTDFFPAERISPVRAKAGEHVFERQCSRCHGSYEKAWNLEGAETLSWSEQIKTVEVNYHKRTPVVDVGTDPGRYLGMRSLEQLNRLAISQRGGMVVRPQKGYVPPPLVGIWARWPYFHNNSAPSLCAVLTRQKDRPRTYFAGEANDPRKDFDSRCNGYPTGDQVPPAWRRDKDAFYDTRRKGMSNSGHDEGIFLRDGKEILSDEDKMNLVAFLQTL